MTVYEKAEVLGYGRYFCRRCADRGILIEACERKSWGIYAGMYCEGCWARDGRNRDDQFDPEDAGERLGEED